MGAQESLTGYADPVLNGMTYAGLKAAHMAGGDSTFVGFPDGAMIPSLIAQARSDCTALCLLSYLTYR